MAVAAAAEAPAAGAAEAAAGQPQVTNVQRMAWYDESKTHGQCVEAPLEYLQDCVMKGNMFAYAQMMRPISSATSCKDLGYTMYLGEDPVFNKASVYTDPVNAMWQAE